MKTDKQKTKVKFLIEGGAKHGNVLAVFPDEIADGQYNKLCYAHIGQHSAVAPRYYAGLKKATPEEYAPLKTELEGIGYNLEVIN